MLKAKLQRTEELKKEQKVEILSIGSFFPAVWLRKEEGLQNNNLRDWQVLIKVFKNEGHFITYERSRERTSRQEETEYYRGDD